MSEDLKKLALKLGTQGPVQTLPTPRLIQVQHSGKYVVKTTRSVFVWEHPYYPQLYIPAEELISYFEARSSDLKIDKGEEFTDEDGGQVLAQQWTLRIKGIGNEEKHVENVLAFSPNLQHDAAKPLQGLVKIPFAGVDHWFEESSPIYIHPKDPFKRIDILQSTRHIRVSVGGHVVADTDFAMHLYETGLPVRYYMPLTRIDASVLRPSQTRTGCPYKGEAKYYHVEVGGKTYEDVVWYYDSPLMESAKVEGLCCFYNEKVSIELDGVALETPVSPFSGKKPGDKTASAV